MNFKTKEDLKKEFSYRNDVRNIDGLVSGAINEAFQSFAERVEFYKKYRCYDSVTKDTMGVTKFRKDFPEIYANADFKKESWWNRWLFDHCFGGITK